MHNVSNRCKQMELTNGILHSCIILYSSQMLLTQACIYSHATYAIYIHLKHNIHNIYIYIKYE